MSVPTLQIRAHSIIEYYPSPGGHRDIQDALTENLVKQETYTGRLSKGAGKRLDKALDLLVQNTYDSTIYDEYSDRFRRFRLNFITLTIPDDTNINGKDAQKKMLQPFLQWMRRVKGMSLYVQKTELQERGQIHFHLTTNCFVHKDELRAKWNEILYHSGYMHDFIEKFGHCSPPSTEVEAVKNYFDLPGYVKKQVNLHLKKFNNRNRRSIQGEFTKPFQNRDSVHGKVWDCSVNLKKGKFYTTVKDYHTAKKLTELVNSTDKDIRAERVQVDRCIIYKLQQPARDVLNFLEKQIYDNHLKKIRLSDFEVELKDEVVLKVEKPPKIIEDTNQISLPFKFNWNYN